MESVSHRFLRDDADLDLLRNHDRDAVDDMAAHESAACDALSGGSAISIQNCEPIRIVRSDDARAIRDRISGIGRRTELGGVSVPVQAAGCSQAAGTLRAVSTALRLESVVRFAGELA